MGKTTVPARSPTTDRGDDLYAWLSDQATRLRVHRPSLIDWAGVAEELEELVALARKETVSRLRTVLAHLLKWRYQTTKRDESSWRTTLVRERLELSCLLESKNLRNYVMGVGYAEAYHGARYEAGSEMQLGRDQRDRLFPEQCEWTLEQALDPDFFPDRISKPNGSRH